MSHSWPGEPQLNNGAQAAGKSEFSKWNHIVSTTASTTRLCDLGRQSDPFVLHLYAALAEKERAMISARTKAGLAAAMARGTKLGMAGLTKTQVRRIAGAGAKANQEAAQARIESIRWAVESALSAGVSLRKAAELLNERGIESPRSERWHAPSLLMAARRLGLR